MGGMSPFNIDLLKWDGGNLHAGDNPEEGEESLALLALSFGARGRLRFGSYANSALFQAQ